MSASREVTPIPKAGNGNGRAGKASRSNRPGSRARVPLAVKSAHREATAELRDKVRATRLRLNPVCEAPHRGLPGECGRVREDAPELEVHEIVPRSRARDSHLVLELTATLCGFHHRAVTSAHGDAKAAAERAMLLLPSEAVVFVQDETCGLWLPFLTDEWYRRVLLARLGVEGLAR